MALPPSPPPQSHHDDLFRSTVSSTAGPSRHQQLQELSGLSWENGMPQLRMQDAVVETVVTKVIRTTTSFAPIALPRIPPPESLTMPTHLSSLEYPLSSEITPEDMRFFPLNIGGRRVVVQEEGYSPSKLKQSGPGWTRVFIGPEQLRDRDAERVGVLNAIANPKGKEVKKRPHRLYQAGTAAPVNLERPFVPTPPTHELMMGPTPQRSPPRKRVRGLDHLHMPQEGALLSPLPSPDSEAPPPLPQPASATGPATPPVGAGYEMAALYSLPSMVAHFDGLPDKLQQHVLMHLLRRSRMPTIHRISEFTGLAMKRDFISRLPHELAVQILQKVDSRTLAVATGVSRKWKSMIDTERSVWRQRLVDDDLWCGLSVEEEEESLIRARYELLDEQARVAACHAAAAASEDDRMGDNGDSRGRPVPMLAPERPIPLKHVYRRRYQTNRNWFTKEPVHLSFPGHGPNVVTCLQFDADKILSASDDHSINVYDTRTGQLRKRLEGHLGGVWALQYKGDILVTGSTDRSIRIWNLTTYTQEHVLWGHGSTVRCLQIVEPVYDPSTGEFQPPFPLIVTGSRDASVRVWKLPLKGDPPYRGFPGTLETPASTDNNPYHLHKLEGHGGAVRAVAAHGRLCVSGSYDNTVRVWDIIEGTCLHVLKGHTDRVYSIVLDRQRMRCASGSMDNSVRVWDLITGQCISTLAGHTSLVGLLDISPNHIVSAAADSSLRIWDAATQQLKQILATNGSAITCFQHDEFKIVSGSDGMLKLWDMRSGQYIRDLVIGISSVWQVRFHGNLLVSASNRQGTTVFDVFDFGKLDHCSGVDNDKLDLLRQPAWERNYLYAPIANQSDEVDMEGSTSPALFDRRSHRRGKGASAGAGGSGGSRKPRKSTGKEVDLRSRRSSRLANKEASSSSYYTHDPADRRYEFKLQPGPAPASGYIPDTSTEAGPSRPPRRGLATNDIGMSKEDYHTLHYGGASNTQTRTSRQLRSSRDLAPTISPSPIGRSSHRQRGGPQGQQQNHDQNMRTSRNTRLMNEYEGQARDQPRTMLSVPHRDNAPGGHGLGVASGSGSGSASGSGSRFHLEDSPTPAPRRGGAAAPRGKSTRSSKSIRAPGQSFAPIMVDTEDEDEEEEDDEEEENVEDARMRRGDDDSESDDDEDRSIEGRPSEVQDDEDDSDSEELTDDTDYGRYGGLFDGGDNDIYEVD